MKYENGKDILPEHLLKELQNYVSGKLIYIPAKETKKHWGEASGYRRLLIDRNKNIRTKFNNGISIDSLSNEFCLYIIQ